jgi:outer membrane protein OmpA-like peptidoglycan-associated protein/opacity protein-like surface antigen
VALSTTVLAGPALARDGAWYVGGDFGPMIVEDSDADFTPGTTAGTTGALQIGFDEGFDGSGFVGYDFGAFRIEAEVSYKQADVEEVLTTGLVAPGSGTGSGVFTGGNGDVSILAGMVNGLLDFGDEDGLSGFAGGGVGLARVDINGITAFTNTGAIIDDSDTRFAWQVLAGVRQAITPNIDIHLKYRFFNVDDLEMVGFGGRAVGTDLRSHSLLGGITFNFGAPEEVECLAPNYLDANGVCVEPPRVPECPAGTRLNANNECETIVVEQPVIYTDCPDGSRVVQGTPCPAVVIPPAIVFFDWDRDDLTNEARNTLNTVAENYRRGGQTQVVLAGHADRSGSDAYNQGLSQRRANRVRDYLITQGVPAGSMTTQAFGEERPRVETADGVREPDNRRVEITFGPGSGW